jgi:acyl-CoA synthetase (AMP-forming)/AMP-acid ligase II
VSAERPVSVIRTTAEPDPTDVRRYRAEGMWLTDAVDAIADAAAADPDRIALVDRIGRTSYGELDRLVGAAATDLRDAGVEVEEPVLLLAANTSPSAIAFHALRRLGATAVLVPANVGAADLESVVRRVHPRFAISPSASFGGSAAAHPSVEWLSTEHLLRVLDGRERLGSPAHRSPDAPGLVLFTSGTTSEPKGVLHSDNTLRVAAHNYIAAAGLGPEDRFFLVSPLASITGVLQALVMAPSMGARVILEEHWDDQATFDLLVQELGTFYGGPDVVIGRLLAEAASRSMTDLPLRAVSVGGTVLDDALLRRAEDDFGIVVMRAYGSSEAPFSTTTPRDAPREPRLELDGVPLRGVSVRIGTAFDPGECAVKGPHLFLGYLDAADNEGAFDDGWFCTGDLGVMTDGNLKISGRLKEIVIRNGLKVSMAEVETAAAKLPFIGEAAAFRRSDPATGERLVLAVRPNEGEHVDLETCVEGLLGLGLAKNRLPEELVVWDAPFPRTNTEKVQRDALAEQSAGRPRFLADRIRV